MASFPFYVDLHQAEMLPQLATHFSPTLYPKWKGDQTRSIPLIVGSHRYLAKFNTPIDRFFFHDLIEGGFLLLTRRMEEYGDERYKAMSALIDTTSYKGLHSKAPST